MLTSGDLWAITRAITGWSRSASSPGSWAGRRHSPPQIPFSRCCPSKRGARWCTHSNPSSLFQYVDELVTLSTNQELGFWHTIGTVCRGWCLVMLGQGDRGISEMTAGVYKKTRATLFGPLVFTMFADAFRTLGQADVGLAHLIDAERQAEATCVRYCQCETFRLRGALLTAQSQYVSASCFVRASPSGAMRVTPRLSFKVKRSLT
jgi:hypothetical protein